MMSAWVCSNRHINLLASYAVSKVEVLIYKGNLIEMDGRRLAKLLLDENYKSVNYRYRENDRGSIRFVKADPLPEPVVMLKQIECYQYQTCEHPEWEDSLAKCITDACIAAVMRAFPGKTQKQVNETEEWKCAPWGID